MVVYMTKNHAAGYRRAQINAICLVNVTKHRNILPGKDFLP